MWVIITGKGKEFFDVHSFIDRTHQLNAYYLPATVSGAWLLVLSGETSKKARITIWGEQSDEKHVGHGGTRDGGGVSWKAS